MRTIRTLLTVFIVAITMAVAVGTTSANRLSVSSTSVYHIWRAVEFVPSFGGTVRCELTVLGSFHARTGEKVVGRLSGSITHVELKHPCTGGEASILRETLPWHSRYRGFAGRLPTIQSVTNDAIGTSFRISSTFATCLIRTTAEEPASTIGEVSAEGRITGARLSGRIKVTGAGLCEGTSGSFAGSGTVAAEEGGRTAITIRLI